MNVRISDGIHSVVNVIRYALLAVCLLGAGGVMTRMPLASAHAAGVRAEKDKDSPAITAPPARLFSRHDSQRAFISVQ